MSKGPNPAPLEAFLAARSSAQLVWITIALMIAAFVISQLAVSVGVERALRGGA
jgi:hypothetical protein